MPRQFAILVLFALILGCEKKQGTDVGEATGFAVHRPKEFCLVNLPKDCDGKTDLPVVVSLHDWVGRPALRLNADKLRVFEIAPTGPIVWDDVRFNWSDDFNLNFVRVNAALDEACKKANVKKDRIVLFGTNGGGYVALRLAVEHPETFAGAVAICHGSMSDTSFPGKLSPLLAKRGFVLCFGGLDQPDFLQQGKEAIKPIQDVGGKVLIKVVPDRGGDIDNWMHDLEPEWLEFVLQANKG